MRLWLLVALALAGCAKTGAPEAPPVSKPPIPAELLERVPRGAPIPERPTRLVRLPDGAVVEELRP